MGSQRVRHDLATDNNVLKKKKKDDNSSNPKTKLTEINFNAIL